VRPLVSWIRLARRATGLELGAVRPELSSDPAPLGCCTAAPPPSALQQRPCGGQRWAGECHRPQRPCGWWRITVTEHRRQKTVSLKRRRPGGPDAGRSVPFPAPYATAALVLPWCSPTSAMNNSLQQNLSLSGHVAPHSPASCPPCQEPALPGSQQQAPPCAASMRWRQAPNPARARRWRDRLALVCATLWC